MRGGALRSALAAWSLGLLATATPRAGDGDAASRCVPRASLGRCERCRASEQCEEGRFCCGFMKRCLRDSEEACFPPIASCRPPCPDSQDPATCNCSHAGFPAAWQLPTCRLQGGPAAEGAPPEVPALPLDPGAPPPPEGLLDYLRRAGIGAAAVGGEAPPEAARSPPPPGPGPAAGRGRGAEGPLAAATDAAGAAAGAAEAAGAALGAWAQSAEGWLAATWQDLSGAVAPRSRRGRVLRPGPGAGGGGLLGGAGAALLETPRLCAVVLCVLLLCAAALKLRLLRASGRSTAPPLLPDREAAPERSQLLGAGGPGTPRGGGAAEWLGSREEAAPERSRLLPGAPRGADTPRGGPGAAEWLGGRG